MTASTNKEFFTASHSKLTRFASLANFFAWVALVVYILYALLSILNGWGFFETLSQCPFGNNNPLDCLDDTVIVYSNFAIPALVRLASGIIWALLLKSASLGLNMIVETDLNYRTQLQEAAHE